MIIKCRCGNQITTDLYTTKKWAFDPNGYHGGQYYVKKGSFLYWREYREFGVCPDNIINCYIPEYKSGRGCCDNSWIPYFCKGCGEQLGLQELDCHQNIHFTVNEKKVIRSYR